MSEPLTIGQARGMLAQSLARLLLTEAKIRAYMGRTDTDGRAHLEVVLVECVTAKCDVLAMDDRLARLQTFLAN